ncbi:MAG: phosphate--acyl-ACP acyltransferase, partial [Bacteroidetes bacterium]|nr:phosphate--acyl-ACP acyltransferase [Bacteroidota bacterium]
MNICLDMMGGDFAPLQAVKGIQLYLSEQTAPANLFLTGDQEQIEKLLKEYNISSPNIT